jgi:predicted Zn-dependent protease
MALASGAREAALKRADDAIRLDPHLAGAWALRGRVYRQMNQPERAIADLQRALAFEPDNQAILLDLATMYREHGDHARCLTTIHHLHDTYSPGEEPQNTLQLEGLTLIELKRPLQASEVLYTATQRGPANADLLFCLAQARSAAGLRAEAEAALRQALVVDSGHQRSRALLAELAAAPPAAEPQRR